jgi:hypothetical protein
MVARNFHWQVFHWKANERAARLPRRRNIFRESAQADGQGFGVA